MLQRFFTSLPLRLDAGPRIAGLLIAGLVIALAIVVVSPATAENPVVKMTTNYGEIVIELDAEKAPVTTENFVQYVEDGFYNGTIFHRVIQDFMIQGGGFDPSLTKKSVRRAIENEADNGLANVRGTIAMARTGEPHSATAQFFINTVDNSMSLNHVRKDPQGWGYCVFGKVTSGMDVVDTIAALDTEPKGGHRNVPLEAALIETVEKVSGGSSE